MKSSVNDSGNKISKIFSIPTFGCLLCKKKTLSGCHKNSTMIAYLFAYNKDYFYSFSMLVWKINGIFKKRRGGGTLDKQFYEFLFFNQIRIKLVNSFVFLTTFPILKTRNVNASVFPLKPSVYLVTKV